MAVAPAFQLGVVATILAAARPRAMIARAPAPAPTPQRAGAGRTRPGLTGSPAARLTSLLLSLDGPGGPTGAVVRVRR